jgi:2-polyprenyl-3-methyl-5-hydroxy-6-metoxy-1,4-benzoquinol methylase
VVEKHGEMNKLLILIIASNAEETIQSVCNRIPQDITNLTDIEVLIIDDCSDDATFEKSRKCRVDTGKGKITPRVLRNPIKLGHGGNQKVGYKFAIDNHFDHVALLQGDGLFAPEALPGLFTGFVDDDADVVLGSQLEVKDHAPAGKLSLQKFTRKGVLPSIQNKLLGLDLSGCQSGHRIYSVNALKQIPFELNTNDSHFDTEIMIQFTFAQQKIVEKPIPAIYAGEVSSGSRIRNTFNVIKASIAAYLTNLSLFYDVKYDCKTEGSGQYVSKLEFESTHKTVLDNIRDSKNVLDMGCGPGHMVEALKQLGKQVTGVDCLPPDIELDNFIQSDLDDGLPEIDYSQYDTILLLDIIEHLRAPEKFMLALHASGITPDTRIVITTGNIGFVLSRITHLFGMFNYGKRGILDMTHHRLFTLSSLKKLVKQTNFKINEVLGVPVPFPLAIGNNMFSRLLMRINKVFIYLHKGLFSFQFVLVVESLPSLQLLLDNARGESSMDT